MKSVPYSSLGLDREEVERMLREHRSLPIHTYFDPNVCDFEMEAIFARSWQYFAPLEKLAKKGDVVTGTVGRIPIAVTRAEDGNLHGFINICRHRGYTVVDGDKTKCRSLVCKYHGWAYRLNGQLANAPDTENEEGFNKADFGLLPVSVDTFGLGVFVNPDPDAPTLRETHPTLDRLAVDAGMETDLSRYSLYRTIATEQQSNWKLWYDNGTECYHCPNIHDKSFSEAFDTSNGEYEFRSEGKMTSYAFKAVQSGDPDDLGATFYGSLQLFPGFQTVRQSDMWYFAKVTPTGPDSCIFTADYFIDEGTDPSRMDRWIKIWDKTFTEDAVATEVQQRNLQSGRAMPFRYVSNREELSQFMLHHTWKAYTDYLTDDPPAPEIQAAE